MIKFNKVAASVDDAGVAYYVNWDKIMYTETTLTTIIYYLVGVGADVVHDKITITTGSGDSFKVAEQIIQMVGHASAGDLVTVNSGTNSSITTIIDAAV